MGNLKVSESFRTAALKSRLKAIREMMTSYSSKNYGKELAWACANGLHNVVKCLVENGANIEYKNGLPLFEAVKHDQFPIVKYLVEKGANVNSIWVPIFQTVENRSSRVARFLLGNGVKVCADDLFIFNRAIQWGDEEIVKSMFRNGIYHQEVLDCALWVAVEEGRSNLVKFLISLGADPDNDLAINEAFEGEQYSISTYLLDLVFSKDPSSIKKYKDCLTGKQKVKYAELLTTTDFNMIENYHHQNS